MPWIETRSALDPRLSPIRRVPALAAGGGIEIIADNGPGELLSGMISFWLNLDANRNPGAWGSVYMRRYLNDDNGGPRPTTDEKTLLDCWTPGFGIGDIPVSGNVADDYEARVFVLSGYVPDGTDAFDPGNGGGANGDVSGGTWYPFDQGGNVFYVSGTYALAEVTGDKEGVMKVEVRTKVGHALVYEREFPMHIQIT